MDCCRGVKRWLGLTPRQKVYRDQRPLADDDGLIRYRASKLDCAACTLKPRCCPKEPQRKIPRSIHEGARQMARDLAKTDAYVASSYARKKVEMLFAHLKRILGLDRLRLRGPNGARDEFHLAAMIQNLRPVVAPEACSSLKPEEATFLREEDVVDRPVRARASGHRSWRCSRRPRAGR